MHNRNGAALDVDAVFAISLVGRTDRRQALAAAFAPLAREIEFLLVEPDRENPERGCYSSHQACARTALERGARRVLVLEDDATLSALRPRTVERINRFLALRRPELFYLGGILGRMWRIPFPGVVRCRLDGAHAYVLSAAGCRRLLGLPFTGDPVDTVLRRRFRAYGAYPMLSEQHPEGRLPSDIAAFRATHPQRLGETKDEAYWRRNRARQHESVRRNWDRTLLLRWL